MDGLRQSTDRQADGGQMDEHMDNKCVTIIPFH